MGMVEFIVNRMKEELMQSSGSSKIPKVVATGGLATLIESGIDCIDCIDKLLTLEGLEIIYEKNKSHKA
jgi:type III pantothenate kinase